MSSLVVLDTETTGLLQDWSRIVEFSAVWVRDGQGVSAFTSMICPDVLDERADAALAINHIDRNVIRAAPSLDVVRAAWDDWRRQLPAGTYTTAFNAPFDRTHCERAGILLPEWTMCTMQRARRHFKVRSIKLVEAAQRFGIAPFQPEHRALSDAYTAAAVWCALDAAEARDSRGFLPPPGSLHFEPVKPPEPIRDFRGPHAFLSNFYLSPVHIYGWTFPSVEHAFHAMKSVDPANDWPRFLTGTPADAKRLGRSLRLRTDWDAVRVGFMRALVYDKFTRNRDLGIKLRDTGLAQLIEGNTWHDRFWGACTCAPCQHVVGEGGENHLGRILMDVRDAVHTAMPF